MKTKSVFLQEKIITFVSLLSLLSLIFPQTGKVQAKEVSQAVNLAEDNSAEKIRSMPGLPEIKDRKARKVIKLAVTAYSSSRDECDSDPFTTASGSRVKDGTLAHNYLPFGTKVRFPEVFGNKIFTVEDRLAPSKGYYIADMWMPSKAEAKKWGVKHLKMEIL